MVKSEHRKPKASLGIPYSESYCELITEPIVAFYRISGNGRLTFPLSSYVDYAEIASLSVLARIKPIGYLYRIGSIPSPSQAE